MRDTEHLYQKIMEELDLSREIRRRSADGVDLYRIIGRTKRTLYVTSGDEYAWKGVV
mgnify:CR=1 FL=1